MSAPIPNQPSFEPVDGDAPDERSAPGRVRVRRSPRIANFLLAGALLGVVVAFVLTVVFPANSEFPASQVFGLLLLAGIALGGAFGGAVALVLDRVLARRAREVEAERLSASAPAPDSAVVDREAVDGGTRGDDAQLS